MEQIIRDIKEFVSSQNFMRPQKEYKDSNVHIVFTMGEAEFYFSEWSSEEVTFFNDLKESEAGKLLKIRYDNNYLDDFVYQKFIKILADDIDRIIGKNLNNDLEPFYSDICADVSSYFTSKYYSVDTFFIEFYEKYYKNGCIPCGWKGVYPDGQWVIYHPPVQKK